MEIIGNRRKKQFQMGFGMAQSIISICDGHDQINNEMSKVKASKKNPKSLV